MNPDCYRRSPLTHHGTTQEGRLLAALLPDCVKIDGRGLVELICFAGRYAGQLAYYNERNEHDGDWTGLLRPDVSFVTADTAQRRWLPLAATFDKYLDGLVDNLGAGRFKTLFDVAFSLFLEVEEVHRALPAGSPLAADVRREIAGRLRTELTRLIGFYRGATGEGPTPLSLVDSGHWQPPAPDDGFAFRDARAVVDGTLSPLWIPDSTAAPDWRAWSAGITPDETIFTGSNDESTANSIPHVRAVWERAYNAYVRIIGNAADRLESSLTDDAAHQPHVALLLAFFRLFGRAQSDLNALTTKHLDFYLREILDLRTRPPRADSAHVIVELAKHVPEHLIAAGTELKGGKDAEGIERIYVVDEDLVANHARVSALRTLFVDDTDPTGGVFDAPVAKSADGLGEVDLDPESPLFRPFGQPQKADLPRPTMRRSTLGWAFASPLLRLAQGTRVVTLEFLCEPVGGLATLPETELGKWFEVAFSGAEKWIVASDVTAETDITDANNPVLRITATLGAETEPVVDFDDAVLDGAYDTAWPVARIRLRAGEDDTTNRHAKLAQVVVRKVTVTAKVTGMADLVLQNDLGPLDPSGAFLPFGPRPKLGSNFYVGSHEAMTKPLTRLALDLEWLGLPGTSFEEHYDGYDTGISKNTDFKADVMFLTGGDWSVDAGTKPLFDEGLNHFEANYASWLDHISISQVEPSYLGETGGGAGADTASGSNPGSLLDVLSFGEDAPARFVRLVFLEKDNGVTDPMMSKLANEPSLPHFDTFDLTVQQGFLRLELAAPLNAFGHDIYPNLYADRVIKISSGQKTDTGELYVLPNEPYTPTLRFLSLDYEATASLNIGDTAGRDAGQFFQLHPFGLREARQPTPYLLTPYLHRVPGGMQLPYEGALFVGLERAEPGSVVSLLVQVAEGTEDSSRELPDAVVWSYLSSDRWEPLGDAVISDTTRDFLASGILRIQIPDDANDDNALLAGSAPRDERESQPALRWLRASISNNFAALPQMLDVRAQALRATFDDRDNAVNHLETPLPAGKIAKLVRPQSAVRKLGQPYESFGGRPQEAPRRFYVRTSERLRHKRRAITIWDYERLVLEEFPELYKVKCVPHARREPDGQATEVIAGSVVVVVIPDFRNRVAGDKFRPKVSNATRDEIREYLGALNCPFAELQVVNPTYEAIQVVGKVAFTRPDTAVYLNQLRADLDKLLAPWVFEQGRALEFGGTLHRSTVVKFMEDLEYVDFVTDVALNVFDHLDAAIATHVPVIEATTALSILTSNTSKESHDVRTEVCLSS